MGIDRGLQSHHWLSRVYGISDLFRHFKEPAVSKLRRLFRLVREASAGEDVGIDGSSPQEGEPKHRARGHRDSIHLLDIIPSGTLKKPITSGPINKPVDARTIALLRPYLIDKDHVIPRNAPRGRYAGPDKGHLSYLDRKRAQAVGFPASCTNPSLQTPNYGVRSTTAAANST